MMKITGHSHLFKWENLQSWWLNKYFFAPLYLILKEANDYKRNIKLFKTGDKLSRTLIYSWIIMRDIRSELMKDVVIMQKMNNFTNKTSTTDEEKIYAAHLKLN